MMKPLAMCLVLLALAAPALAAKKEEEAIVATLHSACEAIRTGNESLAAEYLGDGFTLIDSSGNVTTREQTLLELRNKEPRYEVFRNHDMKVRLYGDTAVVNGITSLKGVAGGKPFAAELRFTDTLVKRNGKWRIVASHVSALPKPKPAEAKQGRTPPPAR